MMAAVTSRDRSQSAASTGVTEMWLNSWVILASTEGRACAALGFSILARRYARPDATGVDPVTSAPVQVLAHVTCEFQAFLP